MGGANIAIRWVCLTSFGYWSGLLLRDTFNRLWEFVTGLYKVGLTEEEQIAYRRGFSRFIGLQFLLLLLVLFVTAVMAIYWKYDNFNTFFSLNP